MFAVLIVAALAADVPDVPYVHVDELFAVTLFPNGLLSETYAEARTPLHRSASIVFQNTYAGAGALVQLSPAFVGVGPQISLAPIDVFDVAFSAQRFAYFDDGLGLLPYDGTSGKLGTTRDARAAEGFGAGAWVVSAKPTLKLKVGPIIVADAWVIDAIRVDAVPGEAAPYVYEPLRDAVIAYEDVAMDQQAVLLYDALPEGGPTLRIGLTIKDRFTLVSKDRATKAGLLVTLQPGTKALVPTIIGMALFPLHDTDREVGSAPNVVLAAKWEVDRPFAGR